MHGLAVHRSSTKRRWLPRRTIRRPSCRYSEGRAAHWLLLTAADRVDTAESQLRAIADGDPDRLIAETGVRSEVTDGGVSSRLGQKRADPAHRPLDPIVVAAPRIAGAAVAYAVIRRFRNRSAA